MSEKGILLLALGAPEYGRMAYNMAVSIKHREPSINVALAFSGNALNHLGQYDLSKHIDKLVSVPGEYVAKDGVFSPFRAKLHMYELSPWDHTIFLDADNIWLPGGPSPSDMFRSIGRSKFTIQNRGKVILENGPLDKDTSLWADVNEIRDAYGLTGKEYHEIHSEFVYFKKQKGVKAMFDLAIEVHDNLKVKNFVFGGGIPDELPLAIAMAKTGIGPHQTPYTPTYWEVVEKKMLHKEPSLLFRDYCCYSTGGSTHSFFMKDFYNSQVRHIFYKQGLNYPYLLQDKTNFSPERKNL